METVTISKAEYESQQAQITELTKQVQYLMERLRLTKHRQFGSLSEKSEYDFDQMNLFNEVEFFADENATEPELVEIEKHYRKRTRLTTDKLPENLPVEVVEHNLPPEKQVCPECAGKLHVMGKEIRRELKLIPAKAMIVEHVKHVYACRNCEQDGDSALIIKAPMDEPVIKGSFASPEAIAHIITQKFVMGVPLYRQEQDWKRRGILLSRQTMSNWLIRCSNDWLEPVYGALRKMMFENSSALHADETTLQVLREPGKAAQSKSYMWLYRTSGYDRHGAKTPAPIVLCDYQPDRKALRPKEFLGGWRGYLHTDGYAGYRSLPQGIVIVGCMAHARRKFDEALKSIAEKDRHKSGALVGKRYCDRLFAIEKELKGLSTDERYLKRLEQARPVLDEFRAWLENQRLVKNAFGRAVRYALDHWKYLVRYLENGQLEISNNRAERSVKPFVIDRKNFLFANTPKGARASAVAFSIVETAKENGLDPYDYLAFIFKNAPNMDLRNPASLNLLLPHNFKTVGNGRF